MTPLHHFGELLRNSLLAVPLPLVRAAFLALPVGLCLWVLSLPRSAVTAPDAADGRGGANLRPWALLALVIQIVVYSLL